ncbi:hypothetical protein B0H13DRAFT_2688805 [Mycena leptocephala]|nr:hypothetical protein B0H13DRAFT_2688805 [Mycena leptocephala]
MMRSTDSKPKPKTQTKRKTKDAGSPLSSPPLSPLNAKAAVTRTMLLLMSKSRLANGRSSSGSRIRTGPRTSSLTSLKTLTSAASSSPIPGQAEGAKKTLRQGRETTAYALLAKNIFQEDPKEQARYANNPGKYATATETPLCRLKNEYQDLVKKLGATGSEIEGLIGKIHEDWPWWDELHSFWRELPNYNPVGIQSSEPGTDHAAEASNLLQTSSGASGDEGENDGHSATSRAREEEEDLDDTPKSEVREKSWTPSAPPSPFLLPKKKPGPTKTKPAASVGCRDLGLTKANSTKLATAVTKPKHKKPMTAVDRMHESREAESMRLVRKRELQHEEEMARIQVKKKKYELRLLQAQNDRKPLDKRALTSPSPRRRTRVLNRWRCSASS